VFRLTVDPDPTLLLLLFEYFVFERFFVFRVFVCRFRFSLSFSSPFSSYWALAIIEPSRLVFWSTFISSFFAMIELCMVCLVLVLSMFSTVFIELASVLAPAFLDIVFDVWVFCFEFRFRFSLMFIFASFPTYILAPFRLADFSIFA